MKTQNLPAPGAPDIDIARAAIMEPILPLAEKKLGIPAEALVPYGHFKAKLSLNYIESTKDKPDGKLVLVTAVTPTPAGEGKTTTSVGVNDALNSIGLNSMVCLREPSLGPCFGMKGGAAGGGRAQVLPMEDINLHFNGDFHAITSAHSLISAMLDNHMQWGNKLDIDPRRISWRRVVDMNDRALRNIVIGLGGPTQGIVREGGFDITVASEIMAIFCLAVDLSDLQKRIGDIIVAKTRSKKNVTVRDLGCDGAVTVLLKDAFQPNLVQSIEHNLAFIHGGPFANIAHGCNSVIATKTALKLADVVVTEAGFGADLGAEKFLDIKCRQSGLRPDAVVLVCTIRAMKMQGGVSKNDLGPSNTEAVRAGCVNVERHIQNLKKFGVNPIVSINHFIHDTEEEIAIVKEFCDAENVPMVIAKHWAEGGDGAIDLANAVKAELDNEKTEVNLIYKDDDSLIAKVEKVATEIYRAKSVTISAAARSSFKQIEKMGFGHLPICIAKTQSSFSTDPKQLGATSDHVIEVREVTLNAGAGFVVAICGTIMRMPGLPKHPAALDIGLDMNGNIVGLA
ncbi:MAG: formate--tetrahydrofolate ligase [Hellea sp.]|jgi:formate--tetrahydrofolate ligase|nr:formate--tetrahydrofolate ligase [Hellea sp.]MBT5836825.1 formate--tetrahydrofolate ligase [Hellea sp.]MBT7398070.1 formate--tetrahydrofolate ligase [Hellea sp.]MDA8888966.1 formate--tetrahydrofolate ligase [Hellea sp.]MDC0422019.1 formate--tetrahydrofolate ligase [Hellea sp.]